MTGYTEHLNTDILIVGAGVGGYAIVASLKKRNINISSLFLPPVLKNYL